MYDILFIPICMSFTMMCIIYVFSDDINERSFILNNKIKIFISGFFIFIISRIFIYILSFIQYKELSYDLCVKWQENNGFLRLFIDMMTIILFMFTPRFFKNRKK